MKYFTAKRKCKDEDNTKASNPSGCVCNPQTSPLYHLLHIHPSQTSPPIISHPNPFLSVTLCSLII